MTRISPPTKTVKELFKILKELLNPQSIFIADRLRFHCRDQNEMKQLVIIFACYES